MNLDKAEQSVSKLKIKTKQRRRQSVAPFYLYFNYSKLWSESGLTHRSKLMATRLNIDEVLHTTSMAETETEY
jgi:hypothetical protein